MRDVTRVDRHNYPAIFTACLAILADNGVLHRESGYGDGAYLTMLLPAHPASGFGRMEAALLEISGTEEFDTFTTGEDSEATIIAVRDADLTRLHNILNRWFEDGMPVVVG